MHNFQSSIGKNTMRKKYLINEKGTRNKRRETQKGGTNTGYIINVIYKYANLYILVVNVNAVNVSSKKVTTWFLKPCYTFIRNASKT